MRPEVVTACLACDDALYPWRTSVRGSWPRPKPRKFGQDVVSTSLYFEQAVVRPGDMSRRMQELYKTSIKSTRALQLFKDVMMLIYSSLKADRFGPTASVLADIDRLCEQIYDEVRQYARRDAIFSDRLFSERYADAYNIIRLDIMYYQEGGRLDKLRPFVKMQTILLEYLLSFYGEPTLILQNAIGLHQLCSELVTTNKDYLFLSDPEKDSIWGASVDLYTRDPVSDRETDADGYFYLAAQTMLWQLTSVSTRATLEYLNRSNPPNWYRYVCRTIEISEGLSPGTIRGEEAEVTYVQDRLGLFSGTKR